MMRQWVPVLSSPEKELKLLMFGGQQCMTTSKLSWAPQVNLTQSFQVGGRRRDSALEPTTITTERLLETDDNEALHACLLGSYPREAARNHQMTLGETGVKRGEGGMTGTTWKPRWCVADLQVNCCRQTVH